MTEQVYSGFRPTSEDRPATPNNAAPTGPVNGHTARLPDAPASLEETGLSPAFLQELVLKALHYAETPAAAHIAQVIGLPTAQVIELLTILKREDLTEIVGSSDYTTSRDYRYRLTAKGETRAERALDRCRYAGTAPVTLRQYEEVTNSLNLGEWRPSKASVDGAFSSLVLDGPTIERLTSALRSGRSSMVFGRSGNGKSTILQAFLDSLEGDVVVPAAIYANGQIIRVFDPKLHTKLKEQEAPVQTTGNELLGLSKKNAKNESMDRRWIRIKRPGIIVGGELGPESLELGYDPMTRFYQAPAHMKAQGGVLVVDDFGRQRVTPAELLNRWVMSLERGREQLMLRTGEALDMPFFVTILFSTNLNPDDLADPAYLRRIPYKVPIPDCDHDQFKSILQLACDTLRVQHDNDTLEKCVRLIESVRGDNLNGALPRDLMSILIENCRQGETQPVLTLEAMESAYRQFTGIPDGVPLETVAPRNAPDPAPEPETFEN